MSTSEQWAKVIVSRAEALAAPIPPEPSLEASEGIKLPGIGKRVFDLVAASTLIVIGSPVLLAVSLAVATTGRPILYAQERVGRDGRRFRCLKFRTMRPDAERVLAALLEHDAQARAEWLVTQKLRNDPRVTPVGRVLRRLSLDELPQLFNVLRGEMSLIGPRPIVRHELERYGRAARWYLAVRPGITGLWQISGRNDVNYRRRVAFDTYYVRNQSLRLDLLILLKTIKVVLLGRGAY